MIPVCNGKCYLQSELSADLDKKQELPNIKIIDFQPLFCQSLFVEDGISFTLDYLLSYPEYFCEFLISSLVFSVFQPPEHV